MISWWWLIAAFAAGSFFGVMLMGICCARGREDKDKRWWDE